MLINEGVNWSRTFYGDSEKDMKDKEILENLGYFFTRIDLVSRQYPIFYITRHEEKL